VNIRLNALISLCLLSVGGHFVATLSAQDAPSGLASEQTELSHQTSAEQPPPAQAPSPPPPAKSWFSQILDFKLPLVFGITAAEVSSDNIFYQPNKTSDYITQISPFLILTLGTPINLVPTLDEETIDVRNDVGNLNYLQLTGRPTVILYAKNSQLNVVDEYEDGIYSHQFGQASVSLEQNYQKLSQPTIENTAAGTLVNRDIYTTTARASYIYSDKLSAYATANQIISDYKSDLYTDSTEWNGDFYFLYQFFPKLSLGLGPRVGYVEVEKSASQTYEDLLVHAFYPATGKLSFVLAGGGELREFEHNEQAESLTPILEADAVYKPFDSMTITLDAGRHKIVSNTQVGQDFTSTTVSLQVKQRLLQVVYATLTAGYQDDAYSGPEFTGGSTREDDYYYAQAGLEWTSDKGWLVLNGSYQYSRDDSTLKIFSFNENQFRVSATVKY
jgi:hypothetical protein